MANNVTSAPSVRPSPVWIGVALAVVTLAVYWPVAGFQFVNIDDPDYVTENPHVRAGLTVEGFKWAWSSVVVGNWHPITMLTHMLDCQFFGVRPWWPHLVNVMLHTANTALLFGMLKRMTGAVWRSAIVAALFALHPLHVESVAWICERKDVLGTLFWFLTMWFYVRYSKDSHDKYYYGLSLLFFALGLMSKPMLVTLPFTLLLLDFWPLGGRKAVLEKIPYFAMSAVMCVATLRVQKQSGAVAHLQDFPLGERAGNALVSYVRYIEKMFWPRHLGGLYLYRLGQWAWWVAPLAALALLAVTAAAVAQRRRRPYLAMGWFWYVGTLVPVIGLVQVGGQAMADRYTYVPLIGLFVILAWGGWELAEAWRPDRFAPVATAAVVAGCAAMTAHQEFYWKNSETLNKRILDGAPDNFIARNHLGLFYLEANRGNEAFSNLMAAVEENPRYAEAHNNLGLVLAARGQPDKAIKEYREAIRLKADYAEPRINLGAILGGRGQIDDAIQQLQVAVRLKPDNTAAHNNLGAAFATRGQIEEAIGQYREAIRLAPKSAEAHNNLGLVLDAKGRSDEAISEYQEAVRLRPDYTGARESLARALSRRDGPAGR